MSVLELRDVDVTFIGCSRLQPVDEHIAIDFAQLGGRCSVLVWLIFNFAETIRRLSSQSYWIAPRTDKSPLRGGGSLRAGSAFDRFGQVDSLNLVSVGWKSTLNSR